MVHLPESGLNLRWSHARKKEILAKIALHYPEAERETVWEKVQRQYVVCNKDPYLKEHPEYRDEKGYRRNK